jgi:acyl carrier protein
MNRFVAAVADVLEVDALTPDTRFRETPGWCSLKGFGLLVMLENDWETPLGIERFLALRTVRDLWREAFLSFAAGVLNVPRAALSGATAYRSHPAWDSVNHLRLVMEAERRFGVRYPLERIPELQTLEDFLN